MCFYSGGAAKGYASFLSFFSPVLSQTIKTAAVQTSKTEDINTCPVIEGFVIFVIRFATMLRNNGATRH
jgi:hypothetical protein